MFFIWKIRFFFAMNNKPTCVVAAEQIAYKKYGRLDIVLSLASRCMNSVALAPPHTC